MKRIGASRIVVILLSVLVATPVLAQDTAAAAKPMQFLYLLRVVPRFHAESAWTPADNAAVDRHFKRLQDAAAAGKLILAGRTTEPLDTTFGIVIFEAENADAARKFMEEDPAVQAGVMTATLHPYAVALQRTH